MFILYICCKPLHDNTNELGLLSSDDSDQVGHPLCALHLISFQWIATKISSDMAEVSKV